MKKSTTILLFFLACFRGQISSSSPSGLASPLSRIDPLVLTSTGLIKGLISDDGLYSKFLGIPYAVVDEDKPFAPSVPHPPFVEVFSAYDGSVKCPQVNRQDEPEGHIQCLSLNVYVPSSPQSLSPLPVMVYIHGGAFVEGSGTNPRATPKYLMQKEVIVVFINYRLGIYGFMCTDNPKAPGNIGLKDQLLALRWIKSHIGSFGGDTDRITVFGESAGAMSIHLHLISPHEKVFDQAIIQSGPSTSPFTIEDTNNDFPLEIAEKLGLITDSLDEALDFIAEANVDLVIAAANQIKKKSQYSSEPLTKACIEKEFEGIERFVPVNPNTVIPDKAETIPVIIGYASQELIFLHGEQNPDFFSNYSFKDLLSFGFDVTDFDEMADLVRHFYIGDFKPSHRLENEITSFASDFVFNHPTQRAVNLLLESDALAVYQYVFSYIGGLSTVTLMNTTIAGAAHTDDTMYLLDNNIMSEAAVSEKDKLMIERMTTLWTNFAKYGNPTPEKSDLLPVIWKPVSSHSVPYLNIDEDLSIKHRPFHDRMAFWDLFYKLNESKTKWHIQKRQERRFLYPEEKNYDEGHSETSAKSPSA